MADRDDYIRRVKALSALADHPNTGDAERESARASASKLREKHAITHEELAAFDNDFALTGIFGDFLSDAWLERVQRQREHAQAITDAVNAAISYAEGLEDQQLDTLTRFWRKAKDALDRLGEARDAAVLACYEAAAAERMEERGREVLNEYDIGMVLATVKRQSDMSITAVEAALKRAHRARELTEFRARRRVEDQARVCERCGRDSRDLPLDETARPYVFGGTKVRILHPTCYHEESEQA